MEKKTQKRLIIAGIVIISIVAITLVIAAIVALTNKDEPPVNVVHPETPVTTTALPELTIETTVAPKELFIPDIDALFDVSSDMSDADGILGDVRNYDMKAMTLKFDNVEFKPGMKVSDIIDTSYWYTVLEHEVLEVGEAKFVILENDFWSNNEIRLSDLKANRNGNVILWVHNYNDEPAEIRDCTVYKYQISYLGCYDHFAERPVLNYRNEFFLGYEAETGEYDEYTYVTTDMGFSNRYIYGSVDECQVILDFDDDDRFMGITVTYNEFYGPDFDVKDGDSDE